MENQDRYRSVVSSDFLRSFLLSNDSWFIHPWQFTLSCISHHLWSHQNFWEVKTIPTNGQMILRMFIWFVFFIHRHTVMVILLIADENEKDLSSLSFLEFVSFLSFLFSSVVLGGLSFSLCFQTQITKMTKREGNRNQKGWDRKDIKTWKMLQVNDTPTEQSNEINTFCLTFNDRHISSPGVGINKKKKREKNKTSFCCCLNRKDEYTRRRRREVYFWVQELFSRMPLLLFPGDACLSDHHLFPASPPLVRQ